MQTLRHAWPWLESVIVSDPDVMVVLPCLWQVTGVSLFCVDFHFLDLPGNVL